MTLHSSKLRRAHGPGSAGGRADRGRSIRQLRPRRRPRRGSRCRPRPSTSRARRSPASRRSSSRAACFWGNPEGVSSSTSRASPRRRQARLRRRLGRQGQVRAGQRRRHRPRRIGAGHLRPRRRSTYGQLLKVFFSVGHDPTELNHQGADEDAVPVGRLLHGRRPEARHRRLRRPARSREGLPRPHRHRDRPPQGLLPGRGLPPELRHPPPRQPLHRLQRHTEGSPSARSSSPTSIAGSSEAVRVVYIAPHGAWRSLVARLLWEQYVGGSNPLAPDRVKSARIPSNGFTPGPRCAPPFRGRVATG